MNAHQTLVKMVEAALIKLMLILALASMDMMDPTAKMVRIQYHLLFVVDIKKYIRVYWH